MHNAHCYSRVFCWKIICGKSSEYIYTRYISVSHIFKNQLSRLIIISKKYANARYLITVLHERDKFTYLICKIK